MDIGQTAVCGWCTGFGVSEKLQRCIALPTLANNKTAIDAFETVDTAKAFRLEHTHAYTRRCLDVSQLNRLKTHTGPHLVFRRVLGAVRGVWSRGGGDQPVGGRKLLRMAARTKEWNRSPSKLNGERETAVCGWCTGFGVSEKLQRCIALPTLANNKTAIDAFETVDTAKAFRLEHAHAILGGV